MEKFSLSLIEGRNWWQQQQLLGSAWAPAQQHLQEDTLHHISVQMCAKPEQNLTLSMCSVLFALDLYFYQHGLSSASSRFTALPDQNQPGLGLLFSLMTGTTRGILNGSLKEHKNLQQPVGTATWRCTSIQGKVFSLCGNRGWGTALLGHPEVWYPRLQWHLATSVAELPGTAPLTGYSQPVAALDTWESWLNLWKLHNILALAIFWKG